MQNRIETDTFTDAYEYRYSNERNAPAGQCKETRCFKSIKNAGFHEKEPCVLNSGTQVSPILWMLAWKNLLAIGVYVCVSNKKPYIVLMDRESEDWNLI